MVVRPVQPPAGSRVDFSAEHPAAIAALPPRNSVPFAVAPAEPNLDAITTHVMDRIDRRLIAWRERMGKF
jgi:hypothetical protein